MSYYVTCPLQVFAKALQKSIGLSFGHRYATIQSDLELWLKIINLIFVCNRPPNSQYYFDFTYMHIDNKQQQLHQSKETESKPFLVIKSDKGWWKYIHFVTKNFSNLKSLCYIWNVHERL